MVVVEKYNILFFSAYHAKYILQSRAVVAREPHKLDVVGSIPSSATIRY